jgi:cytochrome c oxidase accessory protein FixG
MSAPTLERPRRETVTTIRTDGSRPFLFPTETEGRFTRARRFAAYALIAVYLLLPWIRINGFPAVFLDLAERRFHLFGVTFAAQDMWLLFFVITGLGFSLFFVTSLLGRVWCGWACPQTVFLDHVYRRIEKWIDGDAVQRRVLQASPWTRRKIFKRVAKHTSFILFSALITHLFLAYFVSLPEVWEMVQAAPVEHWGAFAFIVIATGLLYFNFAWFREQMCIVLCPYGRMQSALIDENTLVIGYDVARGEPRGKAAAAGAGDCVDCSRCVLACPAGIDIRQGLQMECIGCTACIDACDSVMTRLHRPTGLIRYDSQNGFQKKKTRWVRARTVLYFGLGIVGAAVALWAFSTVKPANFGVTRMTGAPYLVDAGTVRNQFLVRIVNKRSVAAQFNVRVTGVAADVRRTGFEGTLEVAALGEVVQPLIVQVPRGTYAGPFRFAVRVEDVKGKVAFARDVEFLGPDARLLGEEEAQHK